MTVVGVVAAVAPVGRDDARRAAQEELSKGIYHRNEPGPVERAVDAVIDWIGRSLGRVVDATPGGGLGLLVLLAIVVAAVAVVIWRTGPIRRGPRGRLPVLELSSELGAVDHRRLADEHAAAGRWAEAIRERMRAIVRELESRGVLEPRPGRTADEVAQEGSALVPALAGDLDAAARIFDEVWYGGRPATAREDALMRQADERVRRARLVVGAAAAPAMAGYQVPR
jgi:Domain of unknown function (DUF4129)